MTVRTALSGLIYGAIFAAALLVVREYRDAHSLPRLLPAHLPSGSGGLVALHAGPSSAKHTVTVIGDYSCAGCRQYERQAGPEVRLLTADKDISYRYVLIPRLGDPPATLAARLALCDRRDQRVWKLHEALTDLWAGPHHRGPDVLGVARRFLGVSGVKACLSDSLSARWIAHDRAILGDFARIGIPAIIVDSTLLRPRHSYREVIRYLDDLPAAASR